MGPLIDENVLQVDENNNKFEKSLKRYNNKIFKTIQNKLTASDKIIHSSLNYKFTRSLSILRLPKEAKTGKISTYKKNLSEKRRRIHYKV